ncbi:MAG: addiction module toxin, HicA family [Planctomycetales bacterium]|nr:addiction module toxin, HicA family [Planctomycetales bacterium]NIM09867.1 addiction module toxin, HicA family [Planctomycetales bacterium]NIN09307.1 addiction module toxin, HicA family [Planctomycetales bacterium]NIN78415.1 addiction module toxin, HicA family [Planctomycetales bacterium]NIO35591.1 addiction module toxin, HicA family [Planctomycetales bacterium]
MSTLPVVSGRDVINALGKIGYVLDRQRGSHVILRQQDPAHRRLTVPDHKEISKGTLRAIIRQAGLTVEEFKNLL